jgi:Arc/MetJ-type ribon-helix-helix transcriptional regulator
MPIDKRLGVAASVVLPDHLADRLDEEMQRRQLPSRSAMIRACIEDYFTPEDSSRVDHQLESCNIEYKALEAKYDEVKDETKKYYDTMIYLEDANKWLRHHIDELTAAGAVQAEALSHQLLSAQIAPRAPAEITEVTPSKEIKYREYWWQFWLRPAPP